MPDRVYIFDTTLRDGEQSPGCSMTVAEKLRMAAKLVELGVDILEAGFPIASQGDSEAVDAVARELTARGLKAAPDGTPDLRFHYYLLVTVGTETQHLGQFLPAVTNWGLPPFVPQATSFNIIQTGSLVLDAVSEKAGGVVWRGIAQTEIDEMRTDPQRDVRIGEVVRELVKKFPRK